MQVKPAVLPVDPDDVREAEEVKRLNRKAAPLTSRASNRPN